MTYLRYAVRGLLKNPSFAVPTILTLALGIGVTSAIFSVVYGVLLKQTPYQRPSRICLIWKSVPKKNLERDWTSYPTYMDWKRDAAGRRGRGSLGVHAPRPPAAGCSAAVSRWFHGT